MDVDTYHNSRDIYTPQALVQDINEYWDDWVRSHCHDDPVGSDMYGKIISGFTNAFGSAVEEKKIKSFSVECNAANNPPSTLNDNSVVCTLDVELVDGTYVVHSVLMVPCGNPRPTVGVAQSFYIAEY